MAPTSPECFLSRMMGRRQTSRPSATATEIQTNTEVSNVKEQ
jgi:hypothetical protein